MIETERLELISFTLPLIEAALENRDEFERLLGVRLSTEWPNQDYADILPMKAEEIKSRPEKAKWTRLTIEKESGTVIGEIGCKGGPDAKGEVEIGYGIVPSARKKGYATEMVRGLTAWLFEEEHVKRVTAECLTENPASAKVLKKAGFTYLRTEDGLMQWELDR